MNKSKNTNKYVEEDYFSDDNEDQNDQQIEEPVENYDEEEEEEMDPETRKMLWEASMRRSCNYDFTDIAKDKSKQKKSNSKSNQKQKKKVGLSLEEFNKKIEEEQKAKQPKKFVSKRVEEKKKVNGVEEQVVKRNFNARLPPYNWVHKSKEENVQVDLNNKNDFPSL